MTTHAFESPFRPYNPFIASEDDALELEDVADARDVSYALIPRGPAVSPEEVESHLDVVEVKIRWGTQVLSLAHVEAGKSFTIGEGGDFAVADLVRERVVESRAGATYAVVPTGATATVNVKGEHPRSGAAGEEIALAEGTSVTIDLAPITIELATVRAGKKVPVGFLAALASGAAAAIGLSFVGHTAIIASLAMFMPAMHADDAESISRDQILKMQAMLDASAEREKDLLKNQELASEEPTGGGSKGGEPHQGESGAAGKTTPVTTNGHMAFRGSDDRVRLARREELDLAANGGLIGILRSGVPETGPSSPWATETQLGQDADNKIGAMFGADPNDAMGYGLGLWGTGEGGGGKGAGIGIDGAFATGGGGHVAKAPIIRTPDVSTNGRLPAEVIQRIVRQNFGRFRLCYEAGLRSNPGLTGRVVTKFVIGRDGAVAQAQDAGSDIPSQEVVSCVVRSFNNLSFPQPQGGIAMVTYPIILSPGE